MGKSGTEILYGKFSQVLIKIGRLYDGVAFGTLGLCRATFHLKHMSTDAANMENNPTPAKSPPSSSGHWPQALTVPAHTFYQVLRSSAKTHDQAPLVCHPISPQ